MCPIFRNIVTPYDHTRKNLKNKILVQRKENKREETKSKLKEGPVYLTFLENRLTEHPDRNDYRVQLLMLYSLEHQSVNAALEYRALKEKNLSIAESVQTEMKQHGVDLEADLRRQQ